MENNLWTLCKCKNCNSHIYQVYFGGKKDKIHDTYYCKSCKIFLKLKVNVEQEIIQ